MPYLPPLMWHLKPGNTRLSCRFLPTVTAMTTLGFGDITFHTDAGHIFSMIVTLSGVFFMLISLSSHPLVRKPWMEYRCGTSP